jgi:hypothetical protein
VTLGLASALWLVLVADFATRVLTDRPWWIADARTPPALTAVTATTILGTRLSLLGWQTAAAALLALGAVAFAALLLPVMRGSRAARPLGRRRPCPGPERSTSPTVLVDTPTRLVADAYEVRQGRGSPSRLCSCALVAVFAVQTDGQRAQWPADRALG